MPYENAYAARIENDIVREVIVIPYCNDDDAQITAYCNSIGLPGIWIDCAFTGSRRGKFPGMNDRYDAETDTFTSPVAQPIAE